MFVQMMLLALLAVYTADAAGDDGAAFALVYTAFLVVITWLWYTVRRQDPEEYMAVTGLYLTGMIGSIIVMAASVAVPDEARVWVWAGFVVAWLAGVLLLARATRRGIQGGLVVTDSLVERFGLFIIVLGEVVVGVVTGLSDAERDAEVMVTGVVGLMIRFGIWWTYFDFAGRRLPRTDSGNASPWVPSWMMGHLPLTLSIALPALPW